MKFIFLLFFTFSGINSLVYCQTVEGCFNKGIQKSKLKNYSGAIVDYTKALGLNPEYSAAYLARAEAKNSLKDFRGAIIDFDKALSYTSKKDIHLAVVYLDRGMAKVNTKDLIGAEEDFSLSILNDPNFGKAYTNRGIIRIMLSKKNEGCLDLSKAGELGVPKSYELIQEYCKE